MTTFRRGFKTEANATAREVRAELGLALTGALSPWRLADHLAIPVVGIAELTEACGPAVRHFTAVEQGSFSAVTVFRGNARLIVHNDSHSPGRQSSNVAHELSHALLLHPPKPPLSSLGCRDWDPEAEAEADWLAGALLISEEAALRIVRGGFAAEAAADEYGVSVAMVRWRVNVTGARRRVRGAAAKPLASR